MNLKTGWNKEIWKGACNNMVWMLPHGKKTMGRKHHQKQPLKKDYGYIKEKLISSIHKGITIAEIKGRDKSPFFRRIIHFFTFLYSVGVKEYILLNVLQK